MRPRFAWLGLSLLAACALILWMLQTRGDRSAATASPARGAEALAEVPEPGRGDTASGLADARSLPNPDAPQPRPLEENAPRPVGLRVQHRDGRPWHEEPLHAARLTLSDQHRGLSRLPLKTLDEVLWWSGEAQPDGRLSIELPSQTCWVQASSASWRSAPTEIAPGSEAVLVMERVGAVHGRVLRSDGQPLAGAWLLLQVGRLKDVRSRWTLGNAGLDRRRPVPLPDEDIAVADDEGRFSLPHAPGLLAVAHPDAQCGLAWPGLDGCEVCLDEGSTLEGRILGLDGGLPQTVDELVVRVVEGPEGPPSGRPFAVQRLLPDSSFAFQVSGLSGVSANATLELGDGTNVDYRSAKFGEDRRAYVELHFAESTNVTLRVPGSHGYLARIDLKRVEVPADDAGSVKSDYARRTERTDEWRRRVGWRGATDVVAVPRGSPAIVLGRVVLDEPEEVFDLQLTGGRLFVSVVAPAEVFPAQVVLRREGSVVGDGSPFTTLEAPRPGEEVLVDHVPAGSWLVTAGPSHESSWTQEGTKTIALDTVEIVDGQDSHLVLRDSSRPLDVIVVDEDGQPCPHIAVGVDREVDAGKAGLAFGLTGADGVAHLRVAGPGPFALYAYDQKGSSRVSPTVHGVLPENGLFRMILRQVAVVGFEVVAAEGEHPAQLRLRSADGPSSFDGEVEVEEGHSVYPLRLSLGDWRVEVLDKAGKSLARHSVTIAKPGDQTLRLGE